MKRKRIGLFGGTFNPVHLGHKVLAQASLNYLDRVIVMPCWLSPHKLNQRENSQLVSPEHRINMLKLCFEDMPQVEISRWEVDRKDVSYTWMTLDMLKDEHSDSDIVLIMGWDQFTVLPTWHRFAEWAPQTQFLIFKRPEHESSIQISEELAGLDAVIAKETLPNVSSTEIRDSTRIARCSLGHLVPENVANYLQEQKLYRAS